MKKQNLDQKWIFDLGHLEVYRPGMESPTQKIVDLPHDYMIESDPFPEAVAGPAGGYYNAGVAHYIKMVTIPQEWENDVVELHFDGVMMNATVEVNGNRVVLQHYGYAPFVADLTPYIYFGEENRISLTVNPSMQPNSRWYSGAGIFRSVELAHGPRLHIVKDGIYAVTKDIEDGVTTIAVQVEMQNSTLKRSIAEVTVCLVEDATGKTVVSRKTRMQIGAGATDTAYLVLTVDDPLLWSAEEPNLYKVVAAVQDAGEFRTHLVPEENGTVDQAEVLFGIRKIQADVRHGLRINGKTVKLKGGCLHHDNGLLGAVSLYDAEYHKLSILKSIGFNAVRTTHNPPSAALIEACDRLGIYVFDEAFDAWGIAKRAGDYNQYFDTDWQKDLTAFVKRDRSHPSVIIWSTGNEIPERGGLNNGYTLATRLAEAVRALDPSRPVSNAICSYWNGLDDYLARETFKKMVNASQNADVSKEDTSWEEYSEAFTNGLDIVGYNYMEDKYLRDHEMYPERIILGSENFGNEIGMHWPMIEENPYMIGDFTWTAYDYIGEAGIGKALFLDPDDPLLQKGPYALMSHTSEFPWRLANDADVDINGHILPQGDYRNVVWGSGKTYVYSYDPDNFGKVEMLSRWGFTDGRKSWTWPGKEGRNIQVAVFSAAEEVEIRINGKAVARQKAGETQVTGMPYSFIFDVVYEPGVLEAVSFYGGAEVSCDKIETTGEACAIRLCVEQNPAPADTVKGHKVVYVQAEIVDQEGRVVPDAACSLEAKVEGVGYTLAAFGSGNPITAENYTKGAFISYRGRATAVLRDTEEAGPAVLTICGAGLAPASVTIE